MLIPPKPGSGLFKNLMASSSPETITRHSFWDENAGGSAEDDLKRKRAWRCTPEHITALRTAARRYEKSHNFHNFTVGLEFNDRTTTRFMKSIEIAEPAVYGDTEWIAVLFHGQSFMLHQVSPFLPVPRSSTKWL
jgi:tRNA pseudouridine38-40 synthase